MNEKTSRPMNLPSTSAAHARQAQTPSEPPVITLRAGRLQGAWAASASGPDVRTFKGIPYAAAPVETLRWKPPQAAPAWQGLRDATEFGPDAPQSPDAWLRGPQQSEDCLYLNVWAPAQVAEAALPVMVWIHGGGFAGGSGSDARSDGAALAARGVVVVSFNYRCGLFGFLAHPALSAESSHGVSGNYGLLDQLAALRWVQDNIAAFGGDPQRVTAFGVSAGSASISLLLTSAQSIGLFQQAILHSPGACRPLASLPHAEQAGMALGNDILALRQLTAGDLLQKTGLLTPKVRGLTTPRVLRPIRDGWLIGQDERDAFKAGKLHAMPLIVGSNADEGSLLTAAWPVDTLDQYRDMVQANFGHASEAALKLYPAPTDTQAKSAVAALFADTQFNYGTRLLALSMAAREARTWRYLFKRRRPGQRDGPHHGEEVAHVFGNLRAAPPGETAVADATDEAISTVMMQAWVAFAHRGDPNATGLAHWPPYDPAQDNFLCFDDTVHVDHHWRGPQLDFLEHFYSSAAPSS